MSADDSGRRLRTDAQRNRQRLLEAAEAVFAVEGIAVPIDEIARRASVGAGTVYRHFPTKESLFEAIVVSRFERLTREARDLAASADAGGAFFGFLSRMVEEGAAKRDLTDALTSAGLDIRAVMDGTVGDYRAAIGQLLVRAQQAGAVREDVQVADVMALLMGISVAIRAYGPEVATRMLAIMCDGLRAPPS